MKRDVLAARAVVWNLGVVIPGVGRPGTKAHGTHVVRERAGGHCEAGIPGICTGQAGHHLGEFSHRRSQKQGGTWDVCNGVRACHRCHVWIERNYTLAVQHGLRVPSGVIGPERTPVYLRLQPWWSDWWWLEPNGTYSTDRALDCALALGLPEVPTLPEWSLT